jgi:hypothetical protein
MLMGYRWGATKSNGMQRECWGVGSKIVFIEYDPAWFKKVGSINDLKQLAEETAEKL